MTPDAKVLPLPQGVPLATRAGGVLDGAVTCCNCSIRTEGSFELRKKAAPTTKKNCPPSQPLNPNPCALPPL